MAREQKWKKEKVSNAEEESALNFSAVDSGEEGAQSRIVSRAG